MTAKASLLFDQQFHEGTGVDVDECHGSATLLAYPLSDGPWTTTTRRRRACCSFRRGDDPFGRQPSRGPGGADTQQSSYWDVAVGDHDLLAIADQVCLVSNIVFLRSTINSNAIYGQHC